MSMFGIEEMRKGLKIKMEGQPYLITDYSFMKPGKGQAVYRARIKNMITGTSQDKTWRSGDSFEKADLDARPASYSHEEDGKFVFIDTENYNQVYLDSDVLGDQRYFLIDNCECELLFFEERAISIQLPVFVIKEVTNTEPGVRGDTATNVTKPAFIDTGWEIRVPLFINQGDLVKIDTRTGEYVERANNTRNK